jgi:hypothetical protein
MGVPCGLFKDTLEPDVFLLKITQRPKTLQLRCLVDRFSQPYNRYRVPRYEALAIASTSGMRQRGLFCGITAVRVRATA